MLAAYVDLKKAFDSVHLIFAESLEVLVMALEALHEEAKPLGLEVSWLKTKVQVFGDLLDEAVQSVHACGDEHTKCKVGGQSVETVEAHPAEASDTVTLGAGIQA
ncbi:hypothetical protein GWK47_008308 [Chionoecetes opilio]|uniref:Uncharacterized protein n=1 Tax=Chionoecetes opilio TaxID=41210 RepID=A0A8J5CPA6_CHIOP|nr:hypothetical protein GWK47_008308 [Chionoecetes opilio]